VMVDPMQVILIEMTGLVNSVPSRDELTIWNVNSCETPVVSRLITLSKFVIALPGAAAPLFCLLTNV